MCGIAGILNLKNTASNTDDVHRMLPKLESRGPDDLGVWHDEKIALGHRRLSIIDLSQNAHQPMVNENISLVFNGTIYNFPELRAELQDLGYSFRSHGDTEVILKAYQAWGIDCVEKLHGMFAFAIWDANSETLYLARDRFGIKPLYYSMQNNRLVFASNTQAILAAGGVDTSLDNEALHFHFSLHAVVPAPRTLVQGIRKVAPAQVITIQGESLTKQKYWELDAQVSEVVYSDAEWQEQAHAALRSAVKRRIDIADVPVGVLLSGGIDSSLLVGLLAEQGVSDLQTFSIGFENDVNEVGNEFEFSDMVAKKFNTKHHKIEIPNSEVLKRLPEAIRHMSEPMFGQDAIAFYLLSEQVSKHVKVVQSGQGADEVFAGYFWYNEMQNAPDNLKSEWAKFHYNYVDRDHYEFSQMLGDKYQSSNVTQAWLEQQFAQNPSDSFLSKVLHLDATRLIVDDPVKRVDNMTMAWGLEARVPFLDHELVELVSKMPNHLKLANQGKGVLKSLSRGLLPDAVIDRPKAYFPMPALKYVRGDFLDWMKEILLSDTARARGLYQPDYVEKLLANPTDHFTRINGSKLWHLAVTEAWLQDNHI